MWYNHYVSCTVICAYQLFFDCIIESTFVSWFTWHKFWLGRRQNGKILWCYFSDVFGAVIVMTPLKWRHNWFFWSSILS